VLYTEAKDSVFPHSLTSWARSHRPLKPGLVKAYSTLSGFCTTMSHKFIIVSAALLRCDQHNRYRHQDTVPIRCTFKLAACAEMHDFICTQPV
jgi:hypothetical protein